MDRERMGISKQELFSMLEVSMDRERMGISKQELFSIKLAFIASKQSTQI